MAGKNPRTFATFDGLIDRTMQNYIIDQSKNPIDTSYFTS